MYILFKGVSDKELFGIRRIGTYHEYVVGFIDDSLAEKIKIDHLHFTVLTEEVALCYKFATLQRNYLKVRYDDVSAKFDFNQLYESMELDPTNDQKYRYYLTEQDELNTVSFIKSYMRLILDDVYDNKMKNNLLSVSNLEFNSWEQQRKEAEAYNLDNSVEVPLIQSLANSRGITIQEMVEKILSAVQNYYNNLSILLAKKQQIESEIKNCNTILQCQILLFNRFDYTMVPSRKEEAGIDVNAQSTYDL
jgi:antitoxin component HigA of HigAB toxin-antitoxin module